MPAVGLASPKAAPAGVGGRVETPQLQAIMQRTAGMSGESPGRAVFDHPEPPTPRADRNAQETGRAAGAKTRPAPALQWPS